MGEKFPSLNSNNNLPEKNNQKKNEAEKNLLFSYDMLVSNVNKGIFTTHHALGTVKLLIQRAKEAGVDVSKYEASIPELTKKVWKNFIPEWTKNLKNRSYINEADFWLNMNSSIDSLIDSTKDVTSELFDTEMAGLLRELALVVDGNLQQGKKKGWKVDDIQKKYNTFIGLIQADFPPLNS